MFKAIVAKGSKAVCFFVELTLFEIKRLLKQASSTRAIIIRFLNVLSQVLFMVSYTRNLCPIRAGNSKT